MAYTVKTLAGLSGVSVRTLHFYDEVGLLKPAYLGANGYRYYEEPQLLTLQQILFYRELGIDLKQIKRILGRSDFDKVAALESHRKVLRKDLARTRKLIVTIDKTIEHLKGRKKMKRKEMFVGFDPKQQAKHEQYLIDRFGEGMKQDIAESKRKIKNWTKADWEQSTAAFAGICRDLVAAMKRERPTDSPEVQLIIRRSGKVSHTSKFRPWSIRSATACRDRNRALAFERYLKSGSGRAFLHHHRGPWHLRESPCAVLQHV